MHEHRARRSELATPASSDRMCEKAARVGADLVFLDLEDACAPAVKEKARATAVGALTSLDWGRTVRAVRINGLDTPWCHGDITEVVAGAGDYLDLLIVPKTRSARGAGVDAIDFPYPAYRDLDGYRRSAAQASVLGFDGKWAIHPDQVPIANEVFAPTADEIKEAKQVMEEYRNAQATGVGAIGREGKLDRKSV